MIDFIRALETAWQRMTIILFQPFDLGKWGAIGFSAFLALLAEGGVAFNNPINSGTRKTTPFHYQSLPEALHALKQITAQLSAWTSDPWFGFYVGLGIAYLFIWLVLNWVGSRGEFIFLDNIVRNRAALAWPWRRYAWPGNIWFLFHLVLVLISTLSTFASAGVLLYLNWTWINAERNPTGAEIATLVLTSLLFAVVGIIGSTIKFLIRSLVLPLYFKQTMSLGSALLAVMNLVVTRPASILVYVLVSILLWIAAFVISCLICLATFWVTCWVSCYPFIGTLLFSLVTCELILPVLIFKRCFQLGCLEQFGPEYDVFSVDAAPPGSSRTSGSQPPATT